MKAAAETSDVRQEILDTAQVIMSGKGFSAVGLNEILAAARVPKGSFYHYFGSKEAFGEALLQRYFENYLASMDDMFNQVRLNGAERFMSYWQDWLKTQTASDPQSKCLVVKLAAEVADLSEAMRNVLRRGTTRIIQRLAEAIEAAIADGSLAVDEDPSRLAKILYQSWLGASLMAKITRNDRPLKLAMVATRRALNLRGSD
jgi:TetR/AcrR family transcriptional repressor of nem operon